MIALAQFGLALSEDLMLHGVERWILDVLGSGWGASLTALPSLSDVFFLAIKICQLVPVLKAAMVISVLQTLSQRIHVKYFLAPLPR